MGNIYYSRKLPNGTVRTVGPFRSVIMARRAIGQALTDNGYERTADGAATFLDQISWATPGPHRHTRSGVAYMVHTGANAPDAIASLPTQRPAHIG